MTRARREAGRAGEQAAERHLVRAGFVVLARNYRCPLGEIDLIALDRRTLVFVEVKARCAAAAGSPVEAVSARQRRRIVRAAQHFLVRHGLGERRVRFDVVGVWAGEDPPRCEHVRAAFEDDAP